MATITEISLQTNISINGNHPYRIVCTYLDEKTDVKYTFLSDYVRDDPNALLSSKDIKVFVNPDNMHEYVVDTSFIH